MNKIISLRALLAIVAGLALGVGGVAVAGGYEHAEGKTAKKTTKNLIQKAQHKGEFHTLLKAVDAAGLTSTLEGPGPFTLFAPTDAAFARLPAGTVEDLLKPENKEKLRSILTYHVVPGEITAEQVVKMKELKTVNGKMLPVQAMNGKVMVGGATVTGTDIRASNGIIHVIDTVLMPGEVPAG